MIHLTNINYAEYLPLNVVAFDYAAPGAMGDGGAINIYTKDAQHYYLNYAHEEWTEEQLSEVLPLLSECDFGMFCHGSTLPDGFVEVYMGGGNTLVIPELYEARLLSAFESLQREDPKVIILFQVRSRLIIEFLQKDLIH